MLTMATVQTLAEKLDRNFMTLKAAKQWVWVNHQWDIGGRTKDEFIRNAAHMARREFMANP